MLLFCVLKVGTLTDTFTEEEFNFWMPAQAVVVKGGEKGAEKTGKRWIQGIASTSDRDLQNEVVNQSGIDFSYFKQYGYFNDDHQKGPKFKVGEPTECKVVKNGLYVKGFLHKGKQTADDIWEHMQALETSGSSRKMGFSIEGKIRRRNGTTIDKCWVQNIAITAAPINTKTYADIVKSLNAEKQVEDTEEVSKGLTYDETVQYVQAETGLDDTGANDVAKIVFATCITKE